MPNTPVNEQPAEPFPPAQLRHLEKAIRRIVRSHDLLSKALVKATGVTAAQLVVLKGVDALGEVTTTALSAFADLSAATVVTILDNLEERALIERYRSTSDRRIVHTRLTASGKALLVRAPEPLGEVLAARFAGLGEEKRAEMVRAAAAIADLMEREAKSGREG